MHLAERAMAGGASSGQMAAFGNAVGGLVAAGTTQADALQLSSAVNRVVTVAAGAGVTVSSQGTKLKLNGQYATATAVKVATDSWVLIGNLAA